MGIDKLLTSISTRFIHEASEDFDGEIRRALQQVGELLGCDRASVVQFAPGEDLRLTHEWGREDARAPSSIPSTALAPWMDRLSRFENVTVNTEAILAPRERRALVEFGIGGARSFALLPLAHSRALVGCMAFCHLRQEQPFGNDIVSLLENLGVIFVNALRQRDAEEEQARLEQQLRQSQKMEAIGTLAGGLAHDMNNVLSAIMGAASLLKHDLDGDDPRQQEVSDILDAGKRGRKLMRNLLGFARKGKYRKERVFLWQVASDIAEILQRTVDKQIEIRTQLDPDVPPVAGDPDQLHHALMNICLNAVDAMPRGGVLTVTLDALGQSPGDPAQPAYVRLRADDDGEGMEPETLAHAFEPFFTTKPKGLGTGLGLSMVYGAVENHGGTVEIHSQPGEGTSVTVLLPALAQEELDAPEETVETEAFQSVGESVLLVDDEELIRRVGERLLRKLGYKVTVAVDGHGAVDLLRERASDYQLVILDLVMPGLDGEETFHQLREIDPLVPIILSSGYSRDEKVKRLLMAGANGFLQKPFELKHLARALKQVSYYGFDEESGPVCSGPVDPRGDLSSSPARPSDTAPCDSPGS